MMMMVSCVLAAAACGGRGTKSSTPAAVTQTVAPAAAQPAPTGTDAMTQTVDIGDGRSEADGGVATDTAKGNSAVKPHGKPPARKK